MIARPFVGTSARDFVRTGNRRDYAVPPPAPTVLDKLVASGGEVIGIGKIPDIFAHCGISRSVKATGNAALFDATLEALATAPDRSIVFSNFVDFDMLYGHRRDVDGYAAALEYFDTRMPALIERLGPGDVAILSADHGCDPTWPGSDHTREHVPVLVSGPASAARTARQARHDGGHRAEPRGALRAAGDGLRHELPALITAAGRSRTARQCTLNRQRSAPSERLPRPHGRCGR